MERKTSTEARSPAQVQEVETGELRQSLPSTTEGDLFHYDNLHLENDYIRLLTILPECTRPDESICCTLETYALAESPRYHALSYVWGTTDQGQTIICSGKELRVTPSLHATLLALRGYPMQEETLEDGTTTEGVAPLWIDQICINQDDKSERAHQVKIMKAIYERASLVLISPGEEFNKSVGTLVCNLVSTIYNIDEDKDRWEGLVAYHFFPKDQLLRLLGAPLRADETWSALNITMKLPYFERVWVVQEVLVARKAVIYFPGGALSWNMFLDTYSWLLRFHFHFPDLSPTNPQDGIHLPQILQVYLEAKNPSKAWRLYDLVRETSMLKSTDARDKIFALAGIADDGEGVNINYTKPSREVFEEFTRRTISVEESLMILSNAQQPNVEDRGPPSWVPKWDKKPLLPSLLDRGFDASLGRKPSIRLYQDQGVLNVSGVVLGIVNTTAYPVKPECSWANSIHDLYSCLVEIGFITEMSSEATIARLMREMAWCLVLGKYFEEKRDFHDQSEDILLDELGAYVFNIFLFKAYHDEDEEKLKKLLHLTRLTLGAHHAYPEPTWLEYPYTRHTEIDSWLREMIRILDPELAKDTEKMNTFVWYVVTVFTREPYTCRRFQHRSEVYGAAGYTMRTLFGMNQGSMGAGPPQLAKGDIICVLYGGPTPYALRPTSIPGEYTYLGDCYVHGMMHGEAVGSSKARETWFSLV